MKKETIRKQKATETYYSSFLNLLRGQQMIVLDIPANAVQTSVNCLIDQGFWERQENLNEALHRENSPWYAQAVEIGERSGFWRGRLYSLIEETPLSLTGLVKRTIPPTLVVAAARPLSDGTCELIIQPYTSLSLKRAVIDWEDDNLAAPRVNAAINAVIDHYSQADSLIDSGKPKVIAVKDHNCPASPRKIRDLTGFR